VSAAEALRAAQAAGVGVSTDGCDLLLEAREAPPPQVLSALAGHKREVIDLLQAAGDGWSARAWQAFFDERAGIAEFDGGLSKEDAEARAFACCVSEWLNRNPVHSRPRRCLACGDPGLNDDPLLSFGSEPTGHAWLHSRCWTGWYAGRRAEAILALAAMRIEVPPDSIGNAETSGVA
jgi:hypothetical protein